MDIKEHMKDVPLTITAIQEFRKFLDIMEQFIRSTEAERMKEESQQN
ncbi:MAG: hypothetical protein HQK65_19655 [Desulfamplus sp.]|nr:hypothetical protein [Desulfamplus sp.]